MDRNSAESRELLSLSPGLRTNRVLHDLLLRPRFLGYWTFFEPMHRGTEISDVVVVWDDTAILFEGKTRGVPRPADIGWLREKLGETVDQLNARAELLSEGNVALRNEWRGDLRLDPSRIKHIFGVAVLVAEFEPFEWREVADEEWRRAKIPIQVYSIFDLDELLRVFNTPLDFIVYFELRAKYGLRHQMLVGREIDSFKHILGEWHDLWPTSSAEEGRKVQEYLLELANAILHTPLATEGGYRAWAASLLIDSALRPAERRAEVNGQGRPIGSPEHTLFLNAIESLAELSRNRRTYYGSLWLTAAEEALGGARVAIRSSHSPSRDRSYVLVATPLGKDPSDDLVGRAAAEALAQHRTTSCLVLGASAASICATFETLLKWCHGEQADLPPDNVLLVPKVAWVESRLR